MNKSTGQLRHAILFIALFVLAKTAAAAKLTEYRSENFIVYSDYPATRVNALLQKFETFRLGVLAYTLLETREENPAMRIFMFRSKKEFAAFAEDSGVAGFYRNGWEGPRMVIGPGTSVMTVESILFHEYFHYLLRERSGLRYPKWYDEGFAEVLSTAEVEENDVVIGAVPSERIEFLRHSDGLPLPLKEILAPQPLTSDMDAGQYWGAFYATSWLFTHYLQLGFLSGFPDYSDKVRSFILALNRGESPLDAFPDYFGKSLQEIEEELRRYKATESLSGVRFHVTEYNGFIVRRRLEHNERIAELAELAAACGKRQVALKYLNRSRPNQRLGAKNLALLATLNQFYQPRAAHEAITLAENLESDSRAVTHIAGYYYETLAGRVEQGHWDEDSFSKVIEFADKALSLDASYMPAYRMKWRAQQLKGKRISALKTMMQAYQRHPTHVLLNLEIGVYLAQGKSPVYAIPFLHKVASSSDNSLIIKSARDLIESIEEF